MRTSLQGHGDFGIRMTTLDTDIVAMDGRNSHANQIYQAAKIYLQAISGASNIQKELETKCYILHLLFSPRVPSLKLLGWQLLTILIKTCPPFSIRYTTPYVVNHLITISIG